MSVHFCSKTGVRLVAPGVSKAVDPVYGEDEYSEPAEPGSETKPEKGASSKKAPKDEKPSTPPPPAEPGSETKPEKGAK